MNTGQKHNVIAILFAFAMFALVAFTIIQILGGWSVAFKSGFGGFYFVGLFPSLGVAYAAYVFVRLFLAKRMGIKYHGPLGKAIRRSVAHEIERGGRVRS